MSAQREETARKLSRPLVSIVTPVLNGAKYLEECVNSVVSQDYPRIEHIFVDGGSTDATMEMLSAYAQKYPGRVRVISEPGTGPGEAWNRGLKIAKGEIFGCLGSDDICEPGAIEAVVEFLRSSPDAHFVHGHCDFINEQGEVIGKHRVNGFKLRNYINSPKHIATPSAFYKRDVMEKIGWLDTSGNDFDVIIRMAREFRIYQIEKVLSRVRLRPNSAFNQMDFQKRQEKFRNTYLISRQYGGSAFSGIAMSYYISLVFSWLHLQSHFMPIRNLVHKLRRIPGP